VLNEDVQDLTRVQLKVFASVFVDGKQYLDHASVDQFQVGSRQLPLRDAQWFDAQHS
jgi:hypothetical protein